MFLHVTVNLSTGLGGYLSRYSLPDQVHPLGPGIPFWEPGTPPWDQVHPNGTRYPSGPGTPDSRRLLLRTVRILLECTLVCESIYQQQDNRGKSHHGDKLILPVQWVVLLQGAITLKFGFHGFFSQSKRFGMSPRIYARKRTFMLFSAERNHAFDILFSCPNLLK